MGGDPYWYFVPYDGDVQGALDRLREQEFEAGRYYPAMSSLRFDDPLFMNRGEGAEHESIGDAQEDAAEEGTQSILDIETVGFGEEDEDAPGVARMLDENELREVYGTDEPTRDMILKKQRRFPRVERGHCRYVIVYRDGAPSEIYFYGCTWD